MDELYTFRDCYFETHHVEEAGKKQSDVAQEMERTLTKLEELEGGCCRTSQTNGWCLRCRTSFRRLLPVWLHLPSERFKHKAEFLLQKGRCLNVTPDFSAVAEECLSRAVKLEPGLVEAWNTLGEQYWKKGDLTGAKNCFTGALQQVKGATKARPFFRIALYVTTPLCA